MSGAVMSSIHSRGLLCAWALLAGVTARADEPAPPPIGTPSAPADPRGAGRKPLADCPRRPEPRPPGAAAAGGRPGPAGGAPGRAPGTAPGADGGRAARRAAARRDDAAHDDLERADARAIAEPDHHVSPRRGPSHRSRARGPAPARA